MGDIRHDARSRSVIGEFVANWPLLTGLMLVTVPWLIGIVWLIDVAVDSVG